MAANRPSIYKYMFIHHSGRIQAKTDKRDMQLGGLGERCKLPKWGPGQSPRRKCILMHFELKKMASGGDVSGHFMQCFLVPGSG